MAAQGSGNPLKTGDPKGLRRAFAYRIVLQRKMPITGRPSRSHNKDDYSRIEAPSQLAGDQILGDYLSLYLSFSVAEPGEFPDACSRVSFC